MVMANNSDPNDTHSGFSDRGYAIRADIILSAFVIFFFLMFLKCCWVCINPRDTPGRRRRRLPRLISGRQLHRVFYMDPINPNPEPVTVTGGLDASVLKSLPVFTYSSKTHPDSSLECAVCLSEFKENESVRVLPKCNHTFHLDCIDMWFHSHSTCPTCRQPIELGFIRPEVPAEVVLTITELDSSSRLSQHEEEQVLTSFGGGPTKPMELDVPIRNIEEFVDESTRPDSPASQSVKLPMSRMLSLTRILSMDRRANLSPPPVNPANCGGSVTESDIELGKDEARQTQG